MDEYLGNEVGDHHEEDENNHLENNHDNHHNEEDDGHQRMFDGQNDDLNRQGKCR